MPDWLSNWWFAVGPAAALAVLGLLVQACRMRQQKTEALRQSWRDRGEVTVDRVALYAGIGILIAAPVLAALGVIPLTDPVDQP